MLSPIEQRRRNSLSVYDPLGRLAPPPPRQQPPPIPARKDIPEWDWLGQASARVVAKRQQQEEEKEDGSNPFGRGLGYIINNPITQTALKPLQFLDYGRRAVTLGMEELAEGITGQEFKAMEGDDRSNWDKLKDPEYGVGQLLGDIVDTPFDTFDQWANRGIGLAGDIAFDPLSYVGGIGFATKAAPAGGKFARAANMNKIINQARRSGASDEAIDLLTKKLGPVGKRGWAKADKEILDQAGVRGGVRMTTNPFSPYRGAQFTIPGSEKVTRPLSSLRTGIGEQVGKTRVGRAVQDIRVPNKLPKGTWDSIFRQGDEPLDEALANIDLYQAAKKVGAEFSQPFVRYGDRLAHETRNMSPETKVAIVDALEDSTRAMPAEGKKYRELFNTAWKRATDPVSEGGFGLPGRFRKNYSPHILTRDAIDWRRNPANSGKITAPTGFFTEARYEPSGVTMARKFEVGDEFVVNGVPVKLEKATINEVNTKFREAGLNFDFFESDPGIIAQKYINMLSDDVGGWAGALDVAKRSGNRGPITSMPVTADGTPIDRVGPVTLHGGGNVVKEGDLGEVSRVLGLDEPLNEKQWILAIDKDVTKDVNLATRVKAARELKTARKAITDTRARITALLTQASNGVVSYPGAPSLKSVIRERNVAVGQLGDQVKAANNLVKDLSFEKDMVVDRLAWHSGVVRELEQELLPIDILLREIRTSAPKEVVSALNAERRILVDMYEAATQIGEEARERIARRGTPSRQALEEVLDERTTALYRSVGLEPPARSTTPTTGPRVVPGVGTKAVGHEAVPIERKIAENMQKGVGYKGHMAELVKLTGRTEDDIIADLTRRGIVPKAPKPTGVPSRSVVRSAVLEAKKEVQEASRARLMQLAPDYNPPTHKIMKIDIEQLRKSKLGFNEGVFDALATRLSNYLGTKAGKSVYNKMVRSGLLDNAGGIKPFSPDEFAEIMSGSIGRQVGVDEAINMYFDEAERFVRAGAREPSRDVLEAAAIKLGLDDVSLVAASRSAEAWSEAASTYVASKASIVPEVAEALGEDSQRIAAMIRTLDPNDPNLREALTDEIEMALERRGLPVDDYLDLYEVDTEDILSGLEAGSRPRTRIEDSAGPAPGMKRLYRGEKVGGLSAEEAKQARAARGLSWIDDSPEMQARDSVQGRWFTDDEAAARQYPANRDPDEPNRIVFVDIPEAEYERLRGLSDQSDEVRGLSRDVSREIVLPPELAAQARELGSNVTPTRATSPQPVDNPVLGPQPPERIPSSTPEVARQYETLSENRAKRQALINEANSVPGLESRIRNVTAKRNELLRTHGFQPGEVPDTMTAQAAVDRFNQRLVNQAQAKSLAGEVEEARALTARMIPSGEALLDEYDRLTRIIGESQDQIKRVKAAGSERRAQIAELDRQIEQEATLIQGRVSELPKDRAARAAEQQDEVLNRLISREQAGKQAQLEQVPTQGETRLPNVALPSGRAPTVNEALVTDWGYPARRLPGQSSQSRQATEIDWARRGFPIGSNQITEGVPDVGRHSYVVPRGTEEYKKLLHEQNILKTKLANIKKKINKRRRMVRDDARVVEARTRAETAMGNAGGVRRGQVILPERPGQAPKSLKDFPNWDAATDFWTKQVDDLVEGTPLKGSPDWAKPNKRQKMSEYERIQKQVGEEYGIPELMDEYREVLRQEADINSQLGRKVYEADNPDAVAALSKTINESFDQGELASIARERQAIPDTLRKQAAANQQDKALVERVAARQQELGPKIEALNEPMKEILSNPEAREALSREALAQPEAQRALSVKAKKEAERNASASIAAVAQAQLPKATDDLARAQVDLATIAAGHMDAAKLAGEAKGWLERVAKMSPKNRGTLNVEDFVKAILDEDPGLRSIDNQAIVYNIMKAEELADSIPELLTAVENAKLSGKGDHLSRAVDIVLDPTFEMMFPEMGAAGPIIKKDLNKRLQNVKKITNDSKFWRHIDNLTGLFKTYATLSPGFHTRNALSAAFMNASDGVPLTDSVRAARVMHQYGQKNKEGQKAVIGWLEDQKKVVLNKETGTTMADALDAVSATGVGGRYREHGVGDRTMALNRANERAYSNWMTYYVGKRPGTFVESAVRLPVALDTLRRGGSIEDAINRITRLHFDYSEVSNFDQTMRRLVPFWTFMSRNFPLQIAQMYTNPRAYAKYNSFIRNFKGTPEENEPEYFSKIGAFRFMDAEIRGMPVYLQPDLPHTRLQEELEKASDLLTWENPLRALTDFNPLFTAPAEFATKQDFYTGQRFDDQDYRGTGLLEKPLQFLGQLTNQTKTGASGTVLTSEAFLNAARAVNPLYDRSVRLAPQVTTGANDENAVNRQVESFLRFIGAPVRQLSPQQQQSAAMSRYYDQRDKTSNERWLASQ